MRPAYGNTRTTVHRPPPSDRKSAQVEGARSCMTSATTLLCPQQFLSRRDSARTIRTRDKTPRIVLSRNPLPGKELNKTNSGPRAGLFEAEDEVEPPNKKEHLFPLNSAFSFQSILSREGILLSRQKYSSSPRLGSSSSSSRQTTPYVWQEDPTIATLPPSAPMTSGSGPFRR